MSSTTAAVSSGGGGGGGSEKGFTKMMASLNPFAKSKSRSGGGSGSSSRGAGGKGGEAVPRSFGVNGRASSDRLPVTGEGSADAAATRRWVCALSR